MKKKSADDKTILNGRVYSAFFAALRTEHLSQPTCSVCALAGSTGYFETYYFSTKEQCDQMNLKIARPVEISYRARRFVAGARSNGSAGGMKHTAQRSGLREARCVRFGESRGILLMTSERPARCH